MTRDFSIAKAFDFGFRTMKKKIGFFVPLLLLVGGIQFLLVVSAEVMEWRHRGLYIVLSVASVETAIFFSMGMIRIALNILDFGQAEIRDLFESLPFFLYYMVGCSLYLIIGMGGVFILLFALGSLDGLHEYQYVGWAFIIPGIFWGLKYLFFGFLIVDKGLGPIQALKRSAVITEGSRWDLFLFLILLLLFNLAGVSCSIVGLFGTLPASFLAGAYVYRELLAQVEVPVEEE